MKTRKTLIVVMLVLTMMLNTLGINAYRDNRYETANQRAVLKILDEINYMHIYDVSDEVKYIYDKIEERYNYYRDLSDRDVEWAKEGLKRVVAINESYRYNRNNRLDIYETKDIYTLEGKTEPYWRVSAVQGRVVVGRTRADRRGEFKLELKDKYDEDEELVIVAEDSYDLNAYRKVALVQKEGKTERDNDIYATFPLNQSFYNLVNKNNIQRQDMDTTTFALNQRTMLPLRFVGYVFNFDVEWNNDTKIATFTNRRNDLLEKKSLMVDLYYNRVWDSNNKLYQFDVKPYVKDQRILMPVSQVAKAFGATHGDTRDGIEQIIEWNQSNQTVYIYQHWKTTPYSIEYKDVWDREFVDVKPDKPEEPSKPDTDKIPDLVASSKVTTKPTGYVTITFKVKPEDAGKISLKGEKVWYAKPGKTINLIPPVVDGIGADFELEGWSEVVGVRAFMNDIIIYPIIKEVKEPVVKDIFTGDDNVKVKDDGQDKVIVKVGDDDPVEATKDKDGNWVAGGVIIKVEKGYILIPVDPSKTTKGTKVEVVVEVGGDKSKPTTQIVKDPWGAPTQEESEGDKVKFTIPVPDGLLDKEDVSFWMINGNKSYKGKKLPDGKIEFNLPRKDLTDGQTVKVDAMIGNEVIDTSKEAIVDLSDLGLTEPQYLINLVGKTRAKVDIDPNKAVKGMEVYAILYDDNGEVKWREKAEDNGLGMYVTKFVGRLDKTQNYKIKLEVTLPSGKVILTEPAERVYDVVPSIVPVPNVGDTKSEVNYPSDVPEETPLQYYVYREGVLIYEDSTTIVPGKKTYEFNLPDGMAFEEGDRVEYITNIGKFKEYVFFHYPEPR